MCTVCGCADGETKIEGAKGQGHSHDHHHDHGHGHGHGHHHDHDHGHDHGGGHDHHHHHHDDDLHYGQGEAGVSVAGLSQKRLVEIEQNILHKNDTYAAENRKRIEALSSLALNLVSSPGSGKTTLLVETINQMKGHSPIVVIEGDQQTANDADRIRATGVPAIQVNTGKGCHLDAHMVGHALDHLKPEENGYIFIENVGNLVCPAAFDLGEAAKVAILSVTEGEDKPLKYPDMFAAAKLMILTKIDLLPHLDFDMAAVEANAKRINPDIEIIRLSSKTGEGMAAWVAWLNARRQAIVDHAIAELEAKLAALKSSKQGVPHVG